MANEALIGAQYERRFTIVCPSLGTMMTAVKWPDVSADAIAAFVADCSMSTETFEQRCGVELCPENWREQIHIGLTVTTPGGIVLTGRICPQRGTASSDNIWKLYAYAVQSDNGLRIRDAELSLSTTLDGLELIHVRKHRYDTVMINRDGSVIVP